MSRIFHFKPTCGNGSRWRLEFVDKRSPWMSVQYLQLRYLWLTLPSLRLYCLSKRFGWHKNTFYAVFKCGLHTSTQMHFNSRRFDGGGFRFRTSSVPLQMFPGHREHDVRGQTKHHFVWKTVKRRAGWRESASLLHVKDSFIEKWKWTAISSSLLSVHSFIKSCNVNCVLKVLITTHYSFILRSQHVVLGKIKELSKWKESYSSILQITAAWLSIINALNCNF